LALFILQNFQVQDEEIQTLHLPVVFSAVMNILNVCKNILFSFKRYHDLLLQLHIQQNISTHSAPTFREVLQLQAEVLRHIPFNALLKRPELTEGAQAATLSQSPYSFACTFYGIKPTHVLPVQKDSSSVPFASAFVDVLSLTASCGRSLLSSTKSLILRDVFAQSLLLVGNLVDKLEGKQNAPIAVSWDPTEWFSVVLDTFELEVCFLIFYTSQEFNIRSDRKLYHCGSYRGSGRCFASN
jgi:hypothetical protein